MRVLHVISGLDPENGGPTVALLGLAEAQVAAGLEVSVIATWQRTSGFPNAERLRSHGVTVILVGQAHGKLSRHPDLRVCVERAVAKANIVHIHAIWEQIQHEAMRAACRRKVAYIVTPHGMLSRWSFSKNWLLKMLYFRWAVQPGLNAAAAIHYTADAERDLAARFHLKPQPILEPCGIDLAEFEELPARGSFRNILRERAEQLRVLHPEQMQTLLTDQPLILFLGRLAPQKGLRMLIRAFAEFIAKNATNALLVVAGPDQDNYRQLLEDDIAMSDSPDALQKRIVFTGMLAGRDRIRALVDADLLVLPSHHENFGIVVAEALAAGTPVLVSKGVNIWREIEAAGVGGVVNTTPADISQGLTSWMTDAGSRQAAAAKAQAFAFERYDWRKIAERWVKHYQSVVQPRNASAV